MMPDNKKTTSFQAHCSPSGMTKRLRKHSGDLSEGDRAKPIAKRWILGKRVHFFASGEHVIEGQTDITADEQFHSNILRFAHASLIVNEGVGDKARCYVDASLDPCDVWVFGKPAAEFVRQGMQTVMAGACSVERVADEDQPIQLLEDISHVSDVRFS